MDKMADVLLPKSDTACEFCGRFNCAHAVDSWWECPLREDVMEMEMMAMDDGDD